MIVIVNSKLFHIWTYCCRPWLRALAASSTVAREELTSACRGSAGPRAGDCCVCAGRFVLLPRCVAGAHACSATWMIVSLRRPSRTERNWKSSGAKKGCVEIRCKSVWMCDVLGAALRVGFPYIMCWHVLAALQTLQHF